MDGLDECNGNGNGDGNIKSVYEHETAIML